MIVIVAYTCIRLLEPVGVRDTEGAIPVLMNLPIYLQFIAWRYQCGGGDGI